MTYEDLLKKLQQLTPEQLQMSVKFLASNDENEYKPDTYLSVNNLAIIIGAKYISPSHPVLI